MLKLFIVDKIGPTYDLGNCVKDNKTDWGWSPWSSGLLTYMLLLLRFTFFSKSKKTLLFTFFAVFHTFSRTMSLLIQGLNSTCLKFKQRTVYDSSDTSLQSLCKRGQYSARLPCRRQRRGLMTSHSPTQQLRGGAKKATTVPLSTLANNFTNSLEEIADFQNSFNVRLGTKFGKR